MGPLVLSPAAVLDTMKIQGRTPVQSALAPMHSIPPDFAKRWVRSPSRVAFWKIADLRKVGNCYWAKRNLPVCVCKNTFLGEMPIVDVAVLSIRAGRGCFAVGVRVEVRRAPLHGGSSTGEQADDHILP